jgi:hypothetical protein
MLTTTCFGHFGTIFRSQNYIYLFVTGRWQTVAETYFVSIIINIENSCVLTYPTRSHHQGATDLRFAKLPILIAICKSLLENSVLAARFVQPAIKGPVLKYINKLKWDETIKKWIHKHEVLDLNLLCSVLWTVRNETVLENVLGHVSYESAGIVGLRQWTAAKQSICHACDQ